MLLFHLDSLIAFPLRELQRHGRAALPLVRAVVCGLSAAIVPGFSAGAQPAIPMPPPRPPGIGMPAPPIASPGEVAAPALPPHPISRPGPMAPRRPAIRACLNEWRMLGKADLNRGVLWRDFSRECIDRRMRQRR